MAGRKPKATALKLIQGNPGKRPIKQRTKSPRVGVPPCPEWLSEHARIAWSDVATQLDALGILTHADAHALAGLCESHADWLAARAEIEAAGALTYPTQNGLVKAHPAVAMRSDADRRKRAWLAEFGLTPASRTRVIGALDGEKSDPWDSL